MDMVIQEREADLVIGTFGRAVYILDDIRPLRAIAASGGKILDQKFKVFDPPQAYLIDSRQQPPGNHFPGDAIYEGETKPFGGAMITCYLKEGKREGESSTPAPGRQERTVPLQTGRDSAAVKYDSLTIRIYDGRELIRTLKYPAEQGLNKVTWRLRKKGVRFPNPWAGRYGRSGRFGDRQQEPSGFIVLPGSYKVVISCGDQSDSTTVNVAYDPRMDYDLEGLKACEELYNRLAGKAEALNEAMTRLNDSKTVLSKVEAQVRGKEDADLKELARETKAVRDSLNGIWEYIMGREETKQGISDRSEPTVVSRLFTASRYIQSRPAGPSATERRLVEQADTVIRKALDMTNAFYLEVWPGYREKVENTDFKWFRDFEPIELD